MTVASAEGHAGLSELREATPYAIEVENLTARLGGAPAVRNLSMRVPRGSVYGFVGPNGAGKTTTIRTLATLQRADAGAVRVAGFDVSADPGAVRDREGYMPDFFGVYESLPVAEYLDFYGASHNIPASRRRQLRNELLELVDLGDKREESVEALSRGMKQRLGLARCLIHDPEVLLLDEPASGMDPRARVEMREILRELGRLQKTILISSHILPELAEMCTHIGIIHRGELLVEGPVEAITASLASPVRVRVRVLYPDHVDPATRVLRADPTFQAVEADGERCLVADFSGSEADLAGLLSEMVASGVKITGFTPESGTLEDVFIQITNGDEAEL